MGKNREEFEIYYTDLVEEAQQELLNAFGITDPKEMDWDTTPIATISLIHDDEEDVETLIARETGEIL